MADKLIIRAIFLFFAATGAVAAQTDDTVLSLRQAGWQLVGKAAHDEWLRGAAPYEDLGRLLYVVTYTLRKDGKTMICTLSRDVMRDTSRQSCSKAE